MEFGRAARIVFFSSLIVSFALLPLVQAQEPVSLRFDISGYRVDGNTLLKQRDVDAALAPFVGKSRDFGDVQRALEALQKRYSKAGYASVQVALPEQELSGGVVVLQVIEARIAGIRISGNRHFDTRNILRSLPALREGVTPNARALADNLRLANESPARKSQVVLRPAKDPLPPDEDQNASSPTANAQNSLDAIVEVADETPWRVFTTLDNTGTEQTGRYRLGVGAQHSNLWNRDHILTGQYITSPEKPDQVAIYSLGYRVPFYGLGDSLDIFAGYSDVDAGTTQTPFGPLQFAGKGKVSGVRYNWLLARLGEYEHKIVLGADYRAYDSLCSVGDFGAAGCGAAGASVRVRPVSLGYDAVWTRPDSRSSFYLTAIQNMPGGTNGTEQDLQLARPLAKGGYQILRAGFQIGLAFAGNWQMGLRADAQASSHALIQAEQFGIGGWNSVRGFLEREVASDQGYFGTIELTSANLGKPLGFGLIDHLRLLAFYDSGQVTRNLPLPGDPAKEGIASAGMGLRIGIKKNLQLRFDGAWVLEPAISQRRGDYLGHFGILAIW